MLVSYKWLNEYVNLSNVTPQELADRSSERKTIAKAD